MKYAYNKNPVTYGSLFMVEVYLHTESISRPSLSLPMSFHSDAVTYSVMKSVYMNKNRTAETNHNNRAKTAAVAAKIMQD